MVAFVDPGRDQEEAYVLINDGRGHFNARLVDGFEATFPYGSRTATSVSAGAVNGGSVNDLIFGSYGDAKSGAYIFRNDGKGHFTPAKNVTINYPGNPVVYSAVIADFNHDGYNDLGFSTGRQFFVALGPSWNEPSLFYAEPGPYLPAMNMAIVDFNNDGWLDLAITNPYGIARLYNVPVPNVSPGSIEFSSAGAKTVSIKNTIAKSEYIQAGLVLGSATHAGASSPFRISQNTCGTLAPGASCAITVEYSDSLAASANLYISSNGQFIAAVAVSGN